MDNALSIKFTNRFNSQSLIGVEYPGEILYAIGADPLSHVYANIEKNANLRLLVHDPPFENIEDAVGDLFKIRPNRATLDGNVSSFPSEFRPLVMIFVPDPIRFDDTEIVDNHLQIQTIISKDIDRKDIKISVIGNCENSTRIRKLIHFDDIEIKNFDELSIHNIIPIGETGALLKLRLFYKRVEVDSRILNKKGPSILKPNWFRAIPSRIDPSYSTLESWIKGKGKNPHDDLEISRNTILSVRT